MNEPAAILMVAFKSSLAADEVGETVLKRLPEFAAPGGLRQKYDLHDGKTGVYGGLYVWDSTEALQDLRKSELRAGIAEAYRVIGESRIEVYRSFHTLRDTAA